MEGTEYGDLVYDHNKGKVCDLGVLISVLVDEYIKKYGVGMLEAEIGEKLGESWIKNNMVKGVKYGK